jgi:hypothetical protein
VQKVSILEKIVFLRGARQGQQTLTAYVVKNFNYATRSAHHDRYIIYVPNLRR